MAAKVESVLNLPRNPGFESGNVFWAGSIAPAGWFAQNTPGVARTGAWYARTSNDDIFEALPKTRIVTFEGDQLYLSAWFTKSGTLLNGTARARVVLGWYDATPALLSRSNGTSVLPDDTWQQSTLTGTAPVNAAYVVPSLEAYSLTNGTIWADDVWCSAIGRQTWMIEHHYPLIREDDWLAVRTKVGAGAMQARRVYERPRYRFRLQATHEDKTLAEDIYGFILGNGPDTAFWFTGGEWGTIVHPIFVGIGDGVKTNFLLPNRNILPPLLVYLNGESTSAVSLTASTGLLVFTSAPAANAIITASYRCRYKCVMGDAGGGAFLSEQQIYQALFSYQGLLIEELVP